MKLSLLFALTLITVPLMAGDTFELVPAISMPGQTGVAQQFISDTTHEVQGYTITMIWDHADLEVTDVTLGTDAEAMAPEFFHLTLDPARVPDPAVVVGLIWDTFPPFDGRRIMPGNDYYILDLTYDINPSIPVGAAVNAHFENGIPAYVGGPPLHNSQHAWPAITVHPDLMESPVTIVAGFVRGNWNGDSTINLADPIYGLLYLFLNGPAAPCPDAADANDDGTVGLADAVFLLTVFFGSNPPTVPQPYPLPGLDPTPDGLSCY